MNSGFTFDLSGLLEGMTSAEDRVDAAVRRLAEVGAIKLEDSAKQNARWEDRTGDARRRLKGDVLPVSNGYKLRLAHGVDYGKWLELAHEKRYAIIEETIQKVGSDEIMPAFRRLLDRLGG